MLRLSVSITIKNETLGILTLYADCLSIAIKNETRSIVTLDDECLSITIKMRHSA